MPKGSDNPFPSMLVVEGTAPASPSAGNQRLFIDSTGHHLKRVNSSGTVVDIEAGGGGSAPSYQWIAKTANYTAVAGDFVKADASGGAFTVTLPTAVGVTTPIAVAKKDSSANKVTIATTSAQTINGVSTKTLALQDDVLLFVSDGANWIIASQQLGAVLQLDFNTSTDLFAGVSLTANTWTDIVANQTFTVDDANSLVEIVIGGSLMGHSASVDFATRAVIDSAGTPINKQLGGGYNAATWQNTLQGAGPIKLTGLAAGSHTVKVQLEGDASGGTIYLESATVPAYMTVYIRVTEYKR